MDSVLSTEAMIVSLLVLGIQMCYHGFNGCSTNSRVLVSKVITDDGLNISLCSWKSTRVKNIKSHVTSRWTTTTTTTTEIKGVVYEQAKLCVKPAPLHSAALSVTSGLQHHLTPNQSCSQLTSNVSYILGL